MKKIIIFLFAIFSILILNAQKIGLKVGLNMSGVNTNIELTEENAKELLPGFSGGLAFDYTPNKLGLRVEALYSQKGYKLTVNSTVDGTDVVNNFSLKLNYIEVPILLKYKLGPAYITAGPYLAYAMDGKEIATITVDGKKIAEEQYADYGATPSNDVFKGKEFSGDDITFKRTDLGVNVGLGAEFLMFFTEIRYGKGLTNINELKDASVNKYTKNYTITFSVGILLGK